MRCPDWRRAEYIDPNCPIFLASVHVIGHCDYPLDVVPRVAGELFQLRNLVVTHRGWSLEFPPDAEQQVRGYCRSVFRNIDND